MSLADRSSAQVDEGRLLVADAASPASPVDAKGPQHPVFARLDGLNLSLPVLAGDATIIAYHPLGDERTVALTPIGSQINGGVVSRSIGRVFSGESSTRYYILKGSGRSAADTASVDVGAPADAPITSPVSGVVTGVKEYRLYGKYDDIQIDIRPKGISGVTLSLLFVKDPVVTIGQTLDEGKTQLGKVRAAQGDLGERLATLTHDSGSHVHIQVTRDLLE
ncbi:MAG: M23 family metallopeptidase [Thermoleophilia bacterium]|nr:M23 family metallopeptidase [Thermoleophilia bacterium]